MRLTEKKAIGYAIELWTWLAETGEKSKGNWAGWDTLEEMMAHCPLCEYAFRKATRFGGAVCLHCPYKKVFSLCCEDEAPYAMWCDARTVEEKKKYAGLFLEQLKQLR